MEKNKTILGAKYCAICDFEILGYVTTEEEAQKLIDGEKKRLDLISMLKKRFVRKVIKGKCALPSESKHFYIAEVIA